MMLNNISSQNHTQFTTILVHTDQNVPMQSIWPDLPRNKSILTAGWTRAGFWKIQKEMLLMLLLRSLLLLLWYVIVLHRKVTVRNMLTPLSAWTLAVQTIHYCRFDFVRKNIYEFTWHMRQLNDINVQQISITVYRRSRRSLITVQKSYFCSSFIFGESFSHLQLPTVNIFLIWKTEKQKLTVKRRTMKRAPEPNTFSYSFHFTAHTKRYAMFLYEN